MFFLALPHLIKPQFTEYSFSDNKFPFVLLGLDTGSLLSNRSGGVVPCVARGGLSGGKASPQCRRCVYQRNEERLQHHTAL